MSEFMDEGIEGDVEVAIGSSSAPATGTVSPPVAHRTSPIVVLVIGMAGSGE